MKKLIITAALVISGFVATAANAMPTVAFSKAPSSVVHVDYACGRGFHVTPWGECRPNGWRRPPPPYWGHHRPPPPPYWDRHRPRDWHRHHRYYDE